MKIAVISDTHWGVRNDNKRFLDHQVEFFRKVFFPELERRGIETVIHLGDLVDRRKYIAYNTAKVMREEYLDKVRDHTVILGNHDVTFRDTTDVNALMELLGDRSEQHNVVMYPQDLYIGGSPYLFLPWICAGNAEVALKAIDGTRAEVCFAHLELAGFQAYKGHVMEKGMSRKLFEKFDQVYTGHFHTPSRQDNITYVGAPYEMNWYDADDPRGFSIFDTDTREMEFVRNPLTLHAKLRYDDDAETPDWSAYENKIVRLTVGKRENGMRFDQWAKELDGVGAEVKVVEDKLAVTSLDEAAQVKAGDTLQTIESYVNEVFIGDESEKRQLVGLLGDVYKEALERQQ